MLLCVKWNERIPPTEWEMETISPKVKRAKRDAGQSSRQVWIPRMNGALPPRSLHIFKKCCLEQEQLYFWDPFTKKAYWSNFRYCNFNIFGFSKDISIYSIAWYRHIKFCTLPFILVRFITMSNFIDFTCTVWEYTDDFTVLTQHIMQWTNMCAHSMLHFMPYKQMPMWRNFFTVQLFVWRW
jgi:hypothetical protein